VRLGAKLALGSGLHWGQLNAAGPRAAASRGATPKAGTRRALTRDHQKTLGSINERD
jgi:hypothetical protein